MADYQARTQVAAPAERVFDYLADVGNLPAYFDRMTSARPTDGDAVITTAKLPDGREVEAEAWFRVDRARRSLAWGSEGPNDYHGRLEVAGDGDGCSVAVTIGTVRVESERIQDGLEQTLANVRRLTEGG